MSELKIELTNEQKEVIQRIVDALKAIVETWEKFWERVKVAINAITEGFINYIRSIEPKKRYKLLKKLGITNYIPFFSREGITHCRNNC